MSVIQSKTTYSVAGIWNSFRPGSDGNPHIFLINHEWNSQLICYQYLDDGTPIMKNTIFNEKISTQTVYAHENLFQKIVNKLIPSAKTIARNKWFYSVLKNSNFDLIHAHFGFVGCEMLPLVKKLNLPLVVTIYGVDGSQLLKQKKWIKRYQQLIPYTSKLIVLCEEVKQRFISIGYEEDQILIWQIPIKLDSYIYSKKNVTTSSVKFIIGARFVEKKGHKYLIKAFKELIKNGYSASLTIVGYGPNKGEITKMIEAENLSNFCEIIDVGLNANFSVFFNNQLEKHHVFVLPSISSSLGDDEGGPSLTLVAAQAAGLPIVCSDFPGSEITVFDNETGYICKQKDIDSLYLKMKQACDEKHNWNIMGKKGSDYVKELFQEEKQYSILKNIFTDIIIEHQS